MVHGILIQGTTPDFSFSLPVPREEIKDVRVSFSQKSKEILCKKLEDCILEKNQVIVSLTQEDTFLFFEQKGIITIQLRILTSDKKAYVAEEFYLRPRDVFDKTVMN